MRSERRGRGVAGKKFLRGGIRPVPCTPTPEDVAPDQRHAGRGHLRTGWATCPGLAPSKDLSNTRPATVRNGGSGTNSAPAPAGLARLAAGCTSPCRCGCWAVGLAGLTLSGAESLMETYPHALRRTAPRDSSQWLDLADVHGRAPSALRAGKSPPPGCGAAPGHAPGPWRALILAWFCWQASGSPSTPGRCPPRSAVQQDCGKCHTGNVQPSPLYRFDVR